jgi:hypothetical protein
MVGFGFGAMEGRRLRGRAAAWWIDWMYDIYIYISHTLVGGRPNYPSEKCEFVNGKDYIIPYIMENKNV